MQTITLKASARKIGTKQDLKKIRRAGDVPCIIYGNGTEHVDVAISLADIKKLTDTPKSYIVNIDLDGKVYVCKLHDVQYHPITDSAIHVDFLAISDKKPIEIAVPLNIHGNAEGVKQGGRLIVGSRKVKVSGPMDKLPDTIDVDVTSLVVGKTIYAGEIKVDGCTIVSPKKMMVCEVRYTRNVLTPDEEAASTGTTPAEGAAAPAAEGASAPAAEKKEKEDDKKKK